MATTVTPPKDTAAPSHDADGSSVQDDRPEPVSIWDALAEPIVMPNRIITETDKVDVLTVIPEPIRARAEQSLTINVERVKAAAGSTAKRARVDYHWECQPVTDMAMAAQFVTLLTRYAKHRPSGDTIPHAGPNSPSGQVTARCGSAQRYRRTNAGNIIPCTPDADGAFLGVRYSVRPFEQRKDTARAPGTV